MLLLRFALLVAVTSAVLPSASVEAQPSRSRAGSPRAQAQPLFNEGLELIEAQRWAEGLDRFRAAYDLYESPTIAFNIGYCQRALGRYRDALATFQSFLASELTGAAASRENEARDYVREIEARLATLVLEVPDEQRPRLEVMVDGRVVELPEGALSLRLDPGAHTVHARRDGHEPLFVDRELGPGSRARIVVHLEPSPAHLVVSSNVAAAAVLLDGDAIGVVPFAAEIAPGRHELEVESDDYVTHRAVLDVASGDTARVRANLTEAPVPIYRRWWFWAGVAVVVAGAVVATWALTRPEAEPPPYDGGNLDWVVGALSR